MLYSIAHHTLFRYSAPVSESIMELRMQPRTEWTQRCLDFDLTVSPRTRLTLYRDYHGNYIHHFNVPGRHDQLLISAHALVEVQPFASWPESLSETAWDELDADVAHGDYYEMMAPSDIATPTQLLIELGRELNVVRRGDPMSLLREISRKLHALFEYCPETTQVDSPIDVALRARRGVCQDFAHIMITLVRNLRIPCRYVSGYLWHNRQQPDGSAHGATHAWVEARLPGLGWVGFDPTNNVLVDERYIRAAVGRDYSDVPPTKGTFKGVASSELKVAVRVAPADSPAVHQAFTVGGGEEWQAPASGSGRSFDFDEQIRQQQQQQQQQQNDPSLH